jgi:chromosome segregation ATPase
MKLERLVYDVEASLLHLGHKVFGGGPEERAREELELLREERAQRQASLDSIEAECKAVRERLGAQEAAVALLPSQIESSLRRGKSSQAVRQALELDRLRAELAEDRAALPRLEQTCWSLQFHLRVLQRRIDRLREQLGQGPARPR